MELLIDQCGVEYKHQFLAQQENQLKTNNFVCLVVSGVLLSFVVIKPLNALGEWVWRLANIPTFDPTGIEKNFSQLNEDKGFNRTFKEGDKVLQWEVTSAFGDRVHPVTGAVKRHEGVDISTPIGTPIYAVGRPRNSLDIGKMFDEEIVQVECINDPLGGLTAIAQSSLMKEHKFYYHHLDTCNSGSVASGAIIATSGNSGTSTTGAHLHFGVEFKGRFIDPPSGFLLWTLQGKQPQIENKPIVERLRTAIAGQESNHDSKAVNKDSNALGYGQIMPENIKSWSNECLGSPLTEKEFLSSKDKQIKIIDCKLAQYLTEFKNDPLDIQVKKVAAAWYSGDGNLYLNTKPQKYGSGDYPSINDYSNKVWERFKDQ